LHGEKAGTMIDYYLKVFLATARTCSFTKAAQSLNITQPAVTHQIRNLEEMFKAKLFLRQRNKITLTQAGQILYRYAGQIGHLYREAKNEMTALTGNVCGDIPFGVGALLGIYLIPLMMGGFKKKYADVNLHMQVVNSREAIQLLQDDIIELAIASEPIPDRGYVVIPFYEEDLTVIVPPDHPWCQEGEIPAERIFDEEFLIREPGSGTREIYVKALHQLFPDRHLKVAMVLGSTEAIKRGVIGKMGISIVSPLACHIEEKQGLLRRIDLKGLSIKRRFNILYRSEENLSVQTLKWKEYLIRRRDLGFPLAFV
jgi:DNA-binding transcriptional LysR family regulator